MHLPAYLQYHHVDKRNRQLKVDLDFSRAVTSLHREHSIDVGLSSNGGGEVTVGV